MIWVCTGTRPEVIKCAPIIWELRKRNVPHKWLHLGQHTSDLMFVQVANDLLGRSPDLSLDGPPLKFGERLTAVRFALSRLASDEEPKAIIVQGDTATVLSAALFGVATGIPIAHVEAGLRSNDLMMPEEVIRTIVDSYSQWKFAPTEEAMRNLASEMIDDGAELVGNTFVESAEKLSRNATESTVSSYGLVPNEYILLTIHRPENVDLKQRFLRLFDYINSLAITKKIYFPVHPRTKSKFEQWNIGKSNIAFVDPFPPIEFTALEKYAKLIITDSGGVQEEACLFGVPCITLRRNTERPETINIGANKLVDIDLVERKEFLQTVVNLLKFRGRWSHPYGNGDASQKIVSRLVEDLYPDLLKKEEESDGEKEESKESSEEESKEGITERPSGTA